MTEGKLKQKVQLVIVTISVILLGGKFLAFFLTNSVGILTDAMESIVNVTAGFISLYSLYYAAKPKDKSHPFGHGKVELISASIEGLLIIGAGGLIIYEGVSRFFNPSQIEKLDIGIIIVAIGGITNYLLGWYSIKIGKKHNSIALIAGGKHLHSDTYSTIGLIVGLVLLYITKLAWIDSLLALIFGTIIIVTGISILRKTVANLMDEADTAVLRNVVQTINENRDEDWIEVHNAKVIKYGSQLFLQCDLTLPFYYNIEESHNACVKLANIINSKFTENVQVSVHSDPCQRKYCTQCKIEKCSYRILPFKEIHTITLDEMVKTDEEIGERE